jgi:hypothetical protein
MPEAESKLHRHHLRRWQRIALKATLVLAILVGLAIAGSYLFDEPLRRELEAKLNQNLRGYTVRLEHAHAGPLGLTVTLHGLVVRQQANPEPPVIVVPRLRLRAEWSELLRLHLVGVASFEGPRIHLNLPQLEREAADRLSPKERGWQKALESIYPLKFDRFLVRDGSIVYVDDDPRHPFEITRWSLSATNIRNLASPDRVYPSPVHTGGVMFGTGRLVIDGNANFLSVPFPGFAARYRLQNVPLDRLAPMGERVNLELHGGTMTSYGEVEYAPRIKRVAVANLLLDGVRIDYVHSTATAAAEQRRAAALAAVARRAEESETVSLRLDQLHLTHGSVGFVDRAQNPPYRLYVDSADLNMLNLSNRASRRHQQPATARLAGRFMGSGRALLTAVFRPEAATAELGGELAIEGASLPALNDFLLAYEKVGVAAGTFSFYSQVTVRDRYLHGYVKPLLRDVKLAAAPPAPGQTLGARLKEKTLAALAHLLKNRKTGELATRTDISGPLGDTRSNLGQIVGGLLHNAFGQAIAPGFEGPAHPKAGAKR